MASPRRQRYAGIELPGNLSPDMSAFVHSVKERLEQHTGDRGDPKGRFVTIRDLELAGVIGAGVKNGYGTITSKAGSSAAGSNADLAAANAAVLSTFLNSFLINRQGVIPQHEFLLYNPTIQGFQRINHTELLGEYASRLVDEEFQGSITFTNAVPATLQAHNPILWFDAIDEADDDQRFYGFGVLEGVFGLYGFSESGADPAPTETPIFTIDRNADGSIDGFDFASETLTHNGVPIVLYDRDLIAGAGLTGGGTLAANRTFAVGAGTAITVNADDVAVTVNGITNALLRQGAGLSIIGRSANSTGDVADIVAGTDAFVLRRSGTALDFGLLLTASYTDDSVTYAKIQNVSATARVLGRKTAGAGDIEELDSADIIAMIGGGGGGGYPEQLGYAGI